MSWKKSKIASSLMSLFGESALDPAPDGRMREIRQAMLDCLVGLGEGHQQAKVWARVLYAPDLQTLWCLRSDVMTLLAGRLGESIARTSLTSITHMFKGLLPAAQKARPNRLQQ